MYNFLIEEGNPIIAFFDEHVECYPTFSPDQPVKAHQCIALATTWMLTVAPDSFQAELMKAFVEWVQAEVIKQGHNFTFHQVMLAMKRVQEERSFFGPWENMDWELLRDEKVRKTAWLPAADHLYGCTCGACLLYFAQTTGQTDWDDGEFGPFGAKVLNEARRRMGLSEIPAQYLERPVEGQGLLQADVVSKSQE
jgi:hypothetical protein